MHVIGNHHWRDLFHTITLNLCVFKTGRWRHDVHLLGMLQLSMLVQRHPRLVGHPTHLAGKRKPLNVDFCMLPEVVSALAGLLTGLASPPSICILFLDIRIHNCVGFFNRYRSIHKIRFYISVCLLILFFCTLQLQLPAAFSRIKIHETKGRSCMQQCNI